MRRAELALIPTRIGADRWRHAVICRQPPAACNGLLSHRHVIAHALGVHPIIVLADSDIERPVDLGAVHVALHLNVMLRLRLLDALAFQFVKALLTVRLELGNVSRFRCFRHARLDDAIEATADMTAKVHFRLLFTGGADVDTDSTKIGHDLPFLVMPAPEKPLDASGKRGLNRPSKRQPQPPVARVP